MAGDGGRVPDVGAQRAEKNHVCYIENGRCQFPGCFRRGSADPASVLAALLAENPEATVAAIEALLTTDEAVEAGAQAAYDDRYPDLSWVEDRSPQGEDHEAKLEAIGTYLAQYPPSGFTDRYSAAGWSGIARGVLSAASVFGVSPSRDGTVAVEDTVARIVYFLRYVDWPDVTAADAVEREFGSARAGESKQNADGW